MEELARRFSHRVIQVQQDEMCMNVENQPAARFSCRSAYSLSNAEGVVNGNCIWVWFRGMAVTAVESVVDSLWRGWGLLAVKLTICLRYRVCAFETLYWPC
jgi:hypothetical protein